MDEQLSKIKLQIAKIDELVNFDNWGPEYQLWEHATEKLVQQIFGDSGLKLFNQQQTVSLSYIDDDYNREQYLKELSKRKTILNGLLAEKEEFVDKKTDEVKEEKDIIKKIWKSELALKENLLTTEKAQDLQKSLILLLEKVLPSESLPNLRLQKIRAERRLETWWSDTNGYPSQSPWDKIKPFLELLEQYEAEKTVKRRLETGGLFVESRSQGEDQHLLIGERDGTSEKAHVIIDGKSGEIRIENNRQEPTELVARIETILTLPSGKQIKTTRELIEEI